MFLLSDFSSVCSRPEQSHGYEKTGGKVSSIKPPIQGMVSEHPNVPPRLVNSFVHSWTRRRSFLGELVPCIFVVDPRKRALNDVAPLTRASSASVLLRWMTATLILGKDACAHAHLVSLQAAMDTPAQLTCLSFFLPPPLSPP